MKNKCSVWINDISHKDFSFDGVVEILSGNELNVYVDSLDDSDTQALSDRPPFQMVVSQCPSRAD